MAKKVLYPHVITIKREKVINEMLVKKSQDGNFEIAENTLEGGTKTYFVNGFSNGMSFQIECVNLNAAEKLYNLFVTGQYKYRG
jgi:hypothetical protein